MSTETEWRTTVCDQGVNHQQSCCLHHGHHHTALHRNCVLR